MDTDELRDMMIEITVKTPESHFWVATAVVCGLVIAMCVVVWKLAKNVG